MRRFRTPDQELNAYQWNQRKRLRNAAAIVDYHQNNIRYSNMLLRNMRNRLNTNLSMIHSPEVRDSINRLMEDIEDEEDSKKISVNTINDLALTMQGLRTVPEINIQRSRADQRQLPPEIINLIREYI